MKNVLNPEILPILIKKCNFLKWSFKSLSIILILFIVSFAPMGCKSSKKAKAKADQEAKLTKEMEEQKRRDEAERLKREEHQKALRGNSTRNNNIEDLFSSISSSNSVESANAAIDEALKQFTSPDAPVLIIISKDGDDYDYDEPTTISKYLNYIKDQKKPFNKVHKAEYDSNGKIKELILTTK